MPEPILLPAPVAPVDPAPAREIKPEQRVTISPKLAKEMIWEHPRPLTPGQARANTYISESGAFKVRSDRLHLEVMAGSELLPAMTEKRKRFSEFHPELFETMPNWEAAKARCDQADKLLQKFS